MNDSAFRAAVLGVLSAILIAVMGAGLTTWRDQALQAETLRKLDQSRGSIEVSIEKLETITTELRIAVRILESRNEREPAAMSVLEEARQREEGSRIPN